MEHILQYRVNTDLVPKQIIAQGQGNLETTIRIKFGRDIRGTYLTKADAYFIGLGVAELFKDKTIEKVILGYDMRVNSVDLVQGLCIGLNKKSIKDIYVGCIDTPALYFATCYKGFHEDNISVAGIMITASHNPPEYNGLKIVERKKDGNLIYIEPITTDDGLEIVESRYLSKIKNKGMLNEQADHLKIAKKIERDEKLNSIPQFYSVDHLTLKYGKSFHNTYIAFSTSVTGLEKGALKGLRIVVDGSGGMGGEYLLEALELYDARVIPINISHDKAFTHGLDCLKKENLKQLIEVIQKEKADFGVMSDGDGDRLRFVDNLGYPLHGDNILLMIAERYLQNSQRRGIVFDDRSSVELEERICSFKGKPTRTIVGHCYLQAEMEKDAVFGADWSHYYHNKTFNGENSIVTVLITADIFRKAKKSGKDINSLIKEHRLKAMSDELSFRLSSDDDKKEALSAFVDYIRYQKGLVLKGVSRKPLGDDEFRRDINRYLAEGIIGEYEDCWMIFRASGTEPVMRTNLQLKNDGYVEEANNKLVETLCGFNKFSNVIPNLDEIIHKFLT